MSWDVYVWVDLEFPSDPKDCMTRWKQSPLDGAPWSDWGPLGGTPAPARGFETVAAVLAQAGRHAALRHMQGAGGVFSVALGPTQVKVRATLEEAQADWWRAFVLLARVAAPLGATGEFGWASTHHGPREGVLVTVGEGESRLRPMTPEEVRRLERHPAVVEIEAKLAVVVVATPMPVPSPRATVPRSRYGRRAYRAPAPLPGTLTGSDPLDDEAAAAMAGAADDESEPATDEAAPALGDDDELAAAGEGGEGGEDYGADEAPRQEDDGEASPPPAKPAKAGPKAGRAAGRPAGKSAAKGAAARGAGKSAAKAPKAGAARSAGRRKKPAAAE